MTFLVAHLVLSVAAPQRPSQSPTLPSHGVVRRLPSEVAHSPLAVLSVAAPHRPSDAVLCVSRPSRSPPLLQCCPLPLPTWCCPPGVVRPSDAVLCISRPSWSPPLRPFRLPPQTFWVVPSLAVLSVAAPCTPSDAVLCASILSCPLRSSGSFPH